MIVFPAIDLRGGKVVRLVHGDPARETVHGTDATEVAARWREAGAAWLHVVNLDGALGESTGALDALRAVASVGLPVQFGGGLRALDDAQRALEAGAARVILGTLAVQQPEQAGRAVARFGVEAVVVALDARGGMVATHGWQQTAPVTPADLGTRLAALGVRHALFTDVSRDGDLSGVNVTATVALARETGLQVIASGGVASLDDLRALRAARDIAGVVVGQALYTGAFTLQEALRALREG